MKGLGRLGWGLALALWMAPPAAADDFDALLAAVPAGAGTIVAVDHAKLAGHPHYKDILGFLEAQGWGRTLAPALATATPGKALARSVSFRVGGQEATIAAGKVDVAAMRKHFEGKLGAAFETGTVGDKAWFAVSGKLKAVDLGGGRVVLGPLKALGRVLGVLGGQGKAVTRKGHFKALRREAAKGGAPLWAVGYVPKSVRKRLETRGAKDMAHVERATLSIRGKADLELQLVGHTATPEGASEAAAGINGKIQRKILSNALLKALGIAALVSRLTVKANGKKVTGDMSLTQAQVGLIARYGGKVIAVLK